MCCMLWGIVWDVGQMGPKLNCISDPSLQHSTVIHHHHKPRHQNFLKVYFPKVYFPKVCFQEVCFPELYLFKEYFANANANANAFLPSSSTLSMHFVRKETFSPTLYATTIAWCALHMGMFLSFAWLLLYSNFRNYATPLYEKCCIIMEKIFQCSLGK